MIIYKATNLINGKAYVGQTTRSLKARMQEHQRHRTTHFDRALAKYGIENFKITIIDTAITVEELNEKEQFWVRFFRTFGENGYNMCEGGGNTIGYHHTPETKQVMREKKKNMYYGNANPFYGKHHNEETRKRWSQIRKGRKLTAEWKQHLSETSSIKRKVHNVETDEIFESIKEAAEKYNIVATHISRVCRGKRKTTGGYHWEYI